MDNIQNSLLLNRSVFGDEKNYNHILSLHEAEALLNDWVKNDKLKLHMLQVGHLMKMWALEKEGLSEIEILKWELAGLLHDADWDQWPNLHCKKIIEELEARNIDPSILHAIASHSPRYFGVEPITQMDKMLYAFDELSGFIHAYALMRPNRYLQMEIKGVQKRLKDKMFAANVDRNDIIDACNRANIRVEDCIEFIILQQGIFMQ